MRLGGAAFLALLACLPGCADHGTYMMWNQYDEQRVACDRSNESPPDATPAGYDPSVPYTCIAACLQAGFQGNDRSLDNTIAQINFQALMRLADSDIPPLCRLPLSTRTPQPAPAPAS